MARVRIKGSIAKNLRGRTDWARLKSMTDEQIKAAAATDPDIKTTIGDQLCNFKRVQKTPL